MIVSTCACASGDVGHLEEGGGWCHCMLWEMEEEYVGWMSCMLEQRCGAKGDEGREGRCETSGKEGEHDE